MADYLAAFGFLGNPLYWAVLLFALLIVATIGNVPGVGTTTIAAIAIPLLVFNVDDPVVALTFLAVMVGTNNTLDSAIAILLGYPGAATQVTFLEGHRLALQGKAAYLLGAVYAVSAIGSAVGALALLVTMPFLKPLLLRFSYPEIAAMGLFGVLMVSALSRGAMLKGIIAGLMGILIGTVGTSYIAGDQRYDLGTLYLYEGFPLIPTLIGIFALPELIDLTMWGKAISQPGTVSTREVLRGARHGMTRWKVAIRQSLFGVFLGAVPGIGSAVVDWLAYAFGIGLSKDKSEFGKGSIEGVLFAESAQCSKEGGQAIPTLAFGVPGGSGWALVLATMLIYGVVPGLGMLDINRHLSVTMSMVFTIAMGNLLLVLVGLVLSGQIAKVTLVPYPLLAAAMLPMVFLAAYQATNHWGDILVLCGMGTIGMTMKWLGWPRPPLILGYILGPVIERNLWPSVQVWGFGIIARPITVTLIVLSLAAVWYLTKAMGSGGHAEVATGASQLAEAGSDPVASSSGGPTSVAATALAPAATVVSAQAGWRWQWNAEALFPLALMAVVAWMLVEAQSFAIESSRFLPQLLSLALLPLLGVSIVRSSTGRKGQGDIMDLGMRTGTGAAAVRRLATVGGWLVGYVFAITLVGMPVATIGFALLFGLSNFRAPGLKQLWALVPAGVIITVIFVVFKQIMYIDWPASLLRYFVTSWPL